MLQNARELRKYSLRARNGLIGKVNWLPGRKVILAPEWICDVHWNEATVVVDLERDTIRGSPEYNPTHPMTNDYAGELHAYYGRPRHPQGSGFAADGSRDRRASKAPETTPS